MSDKKVSNKFSSKDWLVLISLALAYFFYVKSKEQIINYPSWIVYLSFFAVIIVAIALSYKKAYVKYQKIQKDKFLFVTATLMKIVVAAYLFSGILLIPFNHYNIYCAENNRSIYEECKISGVSTYSKNRCVYYTFKGRTNVLYGYKPIMEEIRVSKQYDKYYFKAELKSGLLNTYILKAWNIVKIPS